MRPEIAEVVHALPLKVEWEEMVILWVPAVIDCLDLARSEFELMDEFAGIVPDNIAAIDPYSFARVPDEPLFRPREMPLELMCTERFRRLVDAHGLTGLDFSDRDGNPWPRRGSGNSKTG